MAGCVHGAPAPAVDAGAAAEGRAEEEEEEEEEEAGARGRRGARNGGASSIADMSVGRGRLCMCVDRVVHAGEGRALEASSMRWGCGYMQGGFVDVVDAGSSGRRRVVGQGPVHPIRRPSALSVEPG